MSEPRRRGGAIALVVILVLLAAIGALIFWQLRKGSGIEERVVQRYNACAAEIEGDYTQRAPDPPGWTLEPGEAAAAYQQAWGLAKAQDLSNNRLTEALQAATGTTEPPPRTDPVPEACVRLGFPAEPGAPLSRAIDGPSCALIEALRPAMELVMAGSRRKDKPTPLGTFDPFSADPSGGSRSALPFLGLAKAMVLQGLVEAQRGDLTLGLERILAVLRFGNDLGHGGSLINAMIGVAVRDFSLNALHQLILSAALDQAQAERVHQELSWIRGQLPSFQDALCGEVIFGAPLFLSEDARARIKLSSTSDPNATQYGFAERFLVPGLLGHFADQWEDLLNPAHDTVAERFARFEHWGRVATDSNNPLVQIAQPNFARFDLKHTGSESRLVFVQIAAADLAFMRREGKLAPDLATLHKAGFTIPDDPLTRAPLTLAADPRRVEIPASALDPAWPQDDLKGNLSLKLRDALPPAPAAPAEPPPEDAPAP